jgi:hypothetical protein
MLDDELVERAARAIFMDSYPTMEKEDMWGDAGEKMEKVRAAMRSNARAAITAYLQGAVEAGKAEICEHFVFLDGEQHKFGEGETEDGENDMPTVLILRLPPQNASSAESSAVAEKTGDDPA